MYAQHSYTPRQSRGVGFGAAFMINGAIVAGILLFLAPKFVPKEAIPVLTGRNISIDPPPAPIEQPKPRAEPRTSTAPRIVAPKPVIDTETKLPVDTTIVIPPEPPIRDVAEKIGTSTIAAEPTPLPLPPLVAATQDSRFAAAFQPDYPASELRAERNGEVSIRVLIGTDGRVKAVEQRSATSPAFFEATKRQALGKWRFKPASRGGVPQESWKVMNVRFNIQDQ